MATRPNKVQEKQEAADPQKKESSIPDNALRPKDHLPAKADVTDNGPVTFEYDGETYEFAVDVQKVIKNVDFLEQLQDNNIIGPIRRLMGMQSWAQFKNRYRDENGDLEVEPHVNGAFEAAMGVLRAKNS